MPKASESRLTAQQVISWFESADPEMADLVMSLAGKAAADRVKRKAEGAERMAKARAGRGKGKAAAAPSVGPTSPAEPSHRQGSHGLTSEQREAVSAQAD
jgi:hypothetical protein